MGATHRVIRLAHRAPQGDGRQPRLRALLVLGVRRQQRARPSAWINADDIGGHDGAARGAWSHVATTYDRATWRLYVNGVQVASRAFTGAIPVSTGALRIGGNSIWGEWFSGQIDEVRVYDRALSPLEVARDRDTPIGGPPPVDTSARGVGDRARGRRVGDRDAISLPASASDDVGVSGVQFKLDGQNLGAEDTTAPYSASLGLAYGVQRGHAITAVARDAAGNTKTATDVNVTVANDTRRPCR